MNINLNLEQLTELNQIRGLLFSPDFESQVLGFEMFKNSDLFRHKFYDLCYTVKNGKQIPLTWFIRKAESIIVQRVNRSNNALESSFESCEGNFATLILPIIDSVLLCEPKFSTIITFNTDKFTIMEKYNPETVLNRYIVPQDQTRLA
jgi:hypothetical protein